MEAQVVSLCARAGLPPHLAPRAAELQRMLAAKGGVGLSSMAQASVCLHLAAVAAGAAADTKAMARLAGLKNKAMFDSSLSTAEAALGLATSLSVQEVAVRVGQGHLAGPAAAVLAAFTQHLQDTLVPAAFAHLRLQRPIYPCAALAAAARQLGDKPDLGRLAELSRAKKKELVELVEEMARVAPDIKKSKTEATVGKDHQELMGRIMGTEEVKARAGARERMKEEDWEEDGFEDWRQAILGRAVAAGMDQYKEFLAA